MWKSILLKMPIEYNPGSTEIDVADPINNPTAKSTEEERREIVKRADAQAFWSLILLLVCITGGAICLTADIIAPYVTVQTSCEAKAAIWDAKNNRMKELQYLKCVTCPTCNLGCALTCDASNCVYQSLRQNCTTACVDLDEFYILRAYLDKIERPDCTGTSKNQDWAYAGTFFMFLALWILLMCMCGSYCDRSNDDDYWAFERNTHNRSRYPCCGILCCIMYRKN